MPEAIELTREDDPSASHDRSGDGGGLTEGSGISVLLAGRIPSAGEIAAGGGVSVVVRDLAAALSARDDVQLTFLAVTRDRPPPALAGDAEGRAWAVGFSYAEPWRLLDVISLLRRRKVDVIDAHGATLLTFMLVIIKRLVGIPLVYTAHGSVQDERELGEPTKPLKAWMEGVVIRNTDGVIVVSDFLRGNLSRRHTLPTGRTATIHNGVDAAMFRRVGEARFQSGFPSLTEFSVFVGIPSHRKALDVLLQAAGEFSRPLLIIGPENDYLRRLRGKHADLFASGRAIAAGAVPREVLESTLEQAGVFVLPSRQDSFPLSVLEAMAKGVPPVISSNVGLRELLKDGENGLIVPPEDPHAVVDAVEGLWRDQERRRRIGAAARATVQGLTWDRIAGEHVGFLKQIVSQRGPR